MHLLSPTFCVKVSFGPNLVQKIKISIYKISRVLFSNMGFNFAHFAYFDFADFEIGGGFA